MSLTDPITRASFREPEPEPEPTFSDLLDEFDGASGCLQQLMRRVDKRELDPVAEATQSAWSAMEARVEAAKKAVIADLDRLTNGCAERLLSLFDAAGF